MSLVAGMGSRGRAVLGLVEEQHMGYSILNANHMANGAITNIGF